jgi:hypothetical protein
MNVYYDSIGTTITSYEYSLNSGSYITSTPSNITTGKISLNFDNYNDIATIIVESLTRDTLYNVSVRVNNSNGSSNVLQKSIRTTKTTPSAPTLTSFTPKNNSVDVFFTPPTDSGNSAITNYVYALNNLQFRRLNPVDFTSPITIPSLTNGITYNLRLAAINSVIQPGSSLIIDEIGDYSELQITAGIPQKPTITATSKVIVLGGTYTITLTFDSSQFLFDATNSLRYRSKVYYSKTPGFSYLDPTLPQEFISGQTFSQYGSSSVSFLYNLGGLEIFNFNLYVRLQLSNTYGQGIISDEVIITPI